MNIPGYDIFEVIGRGGTSIVHRGRQRSLGREVAVKILRDDHKDDADGRRQFLEGGKRASQVIHPASISVYETGEADGTCYIAMELVDGGSLKDAIAIGMEETDAINCLLQVCEALGEAHRHGIVHGDIKPHNILLRDAQQAVLSDYSGAAMEEPTSDEVVGSPFYISPEQIHGQPAQPASDIYSMGILLFEVITGQPPFHAQTSDDIVEQHLNAAIPDLEGRHRIYNPVLHRMLAKNPKDRYPSMAQAAYNIRRAMTLLTEFNQGQSTQLPILEEPSDEKTKDSIELSTAHLQDTQAIKLESVQSALSDSEKHSPQTSPQEPSANTPAVEKVEPETTDIKLPDFGSDVIDTSPTPKLSMAPAEAARPKAQAPKARTAPQPKSPADDRATEHSTIMPIIVWLGAAALLGIALWQYLPQVEEEFDQARQAMETAFNAVETPTVDNDGATPLEPLQAPNTPTAAPQTSPSNGAVTARQQVSNAAKTGAPTEPETIEEIPSGYTPAMPSTEATAPEAATPVPTDIATLDDLLYATPSDIGMPLATENIANHLESQEKPELSVKRDELKLNQSMAFALSLHADELNHLSSGEISLILYLEPGYHKGVARLDLASEARLAQIGTILADYDGFAIQIIDHRFTERPNSEKYARVLRDFLNQQGLPASRLEIGYPSQQDHRIELRLVAQSQ